MGRPRKRRKTNDELFSAESGGLNREMQDGGDVQLLPSEEGSESAVECLSRVAVNEIRTDEVIRSCDRHDISHNAISQLDLDGSHGEERNIEDNDTFCGQRIPDNILESCTCLHAYYLAVGFLLSCYEDSAYNDHSRLQISP